MRVAELIELLQRCPQNNIIMAEISEEEESADITDVLIGSGTIRGTCYIKVQKWEDAE